MSLPRALFRGVVGSGVAALAVTLAVSAATTPHPAATAPAVSQRQMTATYPTNAGKIFRWGLSQWHDGFITRLSKDWAVNRPSLVRNQHGMLTINGTSGDGNVSAVLTGHARRYGRWETRVRAEQYTSAHTPYQVVAELVPAAGRAYHCGARSIVLASYRLGTSRARMAVRNLPNAEFRYSKSRDLRPGPFHTYAVEVTKTHVSWFVDTRVIMTERRSDALSGETFRVRFRLVGVKGRQMNPGRMQMDWIRYYTLDRPNAKSIKAPQAVRGRYAGAC